MPRRKKRDIHRRRLNIEVSYTNGLQDHVVSISWSKKTKPSPYRIMELLGLKDKFVNKQVGFKSVTYI